MKHKKIPTICWICKRDMSECQWIINAIPIDGWNAKSTKLPIHRAGKIIDYKKSYQIKKCPQFIGKKNLRKCCNISADIIKNKF